jgi:phage baseplate assembly protein W
MSSSRFKRYEFGIYGIAPRLPVTITDQEGLLNTKTIEENVKQNLRGLFLTSPGERIMDPEFGVGLRRFLFDQNIPSNRAKIENRIRDQIDKYMPFVIVRELNVFSGDSRNSNLVNINFRYAIDGISSDQILNLSLDPKFTL